MPGLADSGFLTSETLWSALAAMDAAPERVVVLGGGPFGCEISQALARLGSHVTLLERGAHVLAREDTDVSALARTSLESSGVRVLTAHTAVRIDAGAVVTEHQGEEFAVPFTTLIVAAGRKARLTGFGLEALGINTTDVITTNASLKTSFPNIFAAGDVASPSQFTHTAGHQASHASINALFGPWVSLKADTRVIPAVTFVDPEVARVGLTEREAAAQGIPVEVTRYELARLDRAITDSCTTGFVKVLTRPGKDTILGVAIVGAHAGECLAEYVLAMTHGIGLNAILRTVHAYPTMAEASRFVAGRWRANHLPAGWLRLAERYHAWRRG
jgi:pyruvate/2-oxoglutarate dehydrogenase complex dihydrolipoamide dehydrogenase (E3) component